MKFKTAAGISLGLVLCALLLGAYAYPHLPADIPSHWNAAGDVDGYLSKIWGVFLLPCFTLLLLGVLLVLPNIDPKKRNIEKFQGAYHSFVVSLAGFLIYLHFLTLCAASGILTNIVPFLIPALAAFFWGLGALLKKTEPNWIIGIRTPWTLESETVWRQTHTLGGKLFQGLGLVALLALLNPVYGFWIFIAGAVGAAIFLVAYSFWAWRREQTNA